MSRTDAISRLENFWREFTRYVLALSYTTSLFVAGMGLGASHAAAEEKRQPSDYIERGAHVKSNIVLCYERGFDYFGQMRNFTSYFFKDDFHIFDGYEGNDVEDATYVYVRHFPVPDDAYDCARKYPALAQLLDTQVNQKTIDEAFEESRLYVPAGIPLEPLSNGYVTLDETKKNTLAEAIFCHVKDDNCAIRILSSLLSLGAYFCRIFDCQEAIEGQKE